MNENQYVYLMADGDFYKIGKSNDPHKRLKELKTGNPTCTLITYGTGRTEKQLHQIFSLYKVRGEWYKLQESHVLLIKRLLNNAEEPYDHVECTNLRSEALRKKAHERVIFTFGKHKGRKVCEMRTPDEIKYLEWVLTLPRIFIDYPILSKAIRKHFEVLNYKD